MATLTIGLNALSGQSKATVGKFGVFANKITKATADIVKGEAASDEARIDRAIVIVDARDLAKHRKVSFEAWCNEQPSETGWNYNSVKAWFQIGLEARTNRDKALLALTEKREADRKRAMGSRKRTPSQVGNRAKPGEAPELSAEDKAKASAMRRDSVLAELGDNGQRALANDLASKHGQVCVDKALMTELAKLREGAAEHAEEASKERAAIASPDMIMAAFKAMGDNARADFLSQLEAFMSADALDIPDFLKRAKPEAETPAPVSKRRAKRNAKKTA
jgi:hypothetical protein